MMDRISNSLLILGSAQKMQQKEHYVKARPYFWPHDRTLAASNTALVVIDMQRDCPPPFHPVLARLDLTTSQSAKKAAISRIKAMIFL